MFIYDKDRAKREQEGDGNYDSAEKQEREILVEKHRSGATGRFKLNWVSAYTRFFNIPAAQAAQDAKDALETQNKTKPAPKKQTKKEATEQEFTEAKTRQPETATSSNSQKFVETEGKPDVF